MKNLLHHIYKSYYRSENSLYDQLKIACTYTDLKAGMELATETSLALDATKKNKT